MTSRIALQDVVSYFENKTQPILERYGPGPRIHYHTGLVDGPPPKDASIPELRRALVGGQELMLRHAADVWDASDSLSGEILNVGCGLGGGSIFWAEEFGARVTAVTCVPSHADHVARFAAEAGVERRIEPLVCDATEMPGKNRFDAAVAVDSSGYLPRREWLNRMASLLRPQGALFIIDCFLEDPAYANLFDSHWRTKIGTLDEYFAAARDTGLKEIRRQRHRAHRALLDNDARAYRRQIRKRRRRRGQPLRGVVQSPPSCQGWALRRRPSLRHAEFLKGRRTEGERAAGALHCRNLILTRGFRRPRPHLIPQSDAKR